MINKMKLFTVIFVFLALGSMLVNFVLVPNFIDRIVIGDNLKSIKIITYSLVVLTQLPLLYSFYLSHRLLRNVIATNSFTGDTILILNRIKYLILFNLFVYITSFVAVLIIDLLEANVILVLGIVVFIGVVILTFSVLIHTVIKQAFEIKQEHDLTV